MPDAATTVPALGRRFVEALATKEPEAVGAVLHPEIDFRALTPNRFWDAARPRRRARDRAGCLVRPTRCTGRARSARPDAFADRQQGRFRFRGHNHDRPMIVEQQAYLTERDGLIDWMRIVCSRQRAPT